jgi:hypothetical protein
MTQLQALEPIKSPHVLHVHLPTAHARSVGARLGAAMLYGGGALGFVAMGYRGYRRHKCESAGDENAPEACHPLAGALEIAIFPNVPGFRANACKQGMSASERRWLHAFPDVIPKRLDVMPDRGLCTIRVTCPQGANDLPVLRVHGLQMRPIAQREEPEAQ